jgi:hypothetical protein
MLQLEKKRGVFCGLARLTGSEVWKRSNSSQEVGLGRRDKTMFQLGRPQTYEMPVQRQKRINAENSQNLAQHVYPRRPGWPIPPRSHRTLGKNQHNHHLERITQETS